MIEPDGTVTALRLPSALFPTASVARPILNCFPVSMDNLSSAVEEKCPG